MKPIHQLRNPMILALSLAACLWSAPAMGQPGGEGTLLEQAPCAAHATAYDGYTRAFEEERATELRSAAATLAALPRPSAADTAEFQNHRDELAVRTPVDRAVYDSVFRQGRYECVRLRYRSGGLGVAGYIFRPAGTADTLRPVLIFNRGGTGDFGRMTDLNMMRWRRFMDEGYVIVASQYRGSDGAGGVDGYGGEDVDDVLNLRPLIASLPGVDTTNVFMYGASRGGLMAYLALERGMRVNAAVVHAGPVDMEAAERFRPGFEREVFSKIPEFVRDRDGFYRDRNALLGAERIGAPVLILHGTADWRVSADDALKMAARLQALGKPYELVVYDGDDHMLSLNRGDRDRRAMAWFRKHRHERRR